MKLIVATIAIIASSLVHATDFSDQLQAMGFSKQVREQRGGIHLDRIKLPFYGVKTTGTQLQVEADQPVRNGIRTSIDGKLYRYQAINNGEFGGKLLATDAKANSFTVVEDNIVGFFKLQNQLFVLTGLLHMGIDVGSLYRLDEVEGKPRLSLVTLLTGAPVDVVTDGGRVFILTTGDLEMVDLSDHRPSLQIIVHDGPWYSVPFNLAMSGSQFAIGMHAGVVVVNYDKFRRQATVQYYAK
ncbi:hypothetical protein ACO0K9_24530 [Undibacterium sp. Ji50W]|uniref:hypothetical protein n=1 Tax=Undibacterium sp. Ji50W TaxID=3413041 RepID=UPI003BEF95AB